MPVIEPNNLFKSMAAGMIRAAQASASPPSYDDLEKRLWAAAKHDAYVVGRNSDPLVDDDSCILPEGRAYADVIQSVLKGYTREA